MIDWNAVVNMGIGIALASTTMVYLRHKNREPVEVKPPCAHEFVLSNVIVREVYNGYDVDFEDRFVIFCRKCELKYSTSQFEYNKLEKHGLIFDRKKDLQK
jgi:hypothetical protein